MPHQHSDFLDPFTVVDLLRDARAAGLRPLDIKLIVFIADRYAIFDTHEFLVRTGVPLSRIPPHLSSREDILRRYVCLPVPDPVPQLLCV